MSFSVTVSTIGFNLCSGIDYWQLASSVTTLYIYVLILIKLMVILFLNQRMQMRGLKTRKCFGKIHIM